MTHRNEAGWAIPHPTVVAACCLVLVIGGLVAEAQDQFDTPWTGSVEPREPLPPLRINGPQAALFVAPNGEDRNPGTQERPFATLARARDAVRRINREMTGDIVVYLRGGSYFLPEGVRFDVEDSGTNGYQVVYMAYQQEQPVLYGGPRIVGWEKYRGGICRARLPESLRGRGDLWTLLENGRRSNLARHPNHFAVDDHHGGGFFVTDNEGVDAEAGEFRYQPGQFPDHWDARHTLFVRTMGWGSDCKHVVSADPRKRIITLEPVKNKPNRSDPYFLAGSKEFIDLPGEWALGRDGYVYYLPKHTPIEDQVVVLATTQRLINVEGRAEGHYPNRAVTPAHDIVFQGLTLSGTTQAEPSRKAFGETDAGNGNWGSLETQHGLVTLQNARNITVRNCRLTGGGWCGVVLTQYAQGNIIYGNWIEGMNLHGVYLVGWFYEKWNHHVREPTDPPEKYMRRFPMGGYENRNNLVCNNYIFDFGKHYSDGHGIKIVQSGENEISHNEIRKGPRYGISLKGVVDRPGPDASQAGRDFRSTYVYSRNNAVKFNDLSHCIDSTSDTGAIEQWMAGEHNLLYNNFIHDIYHTGYQMGRYYSARHNVYLDDGARYWVVRNNVAWNVLGNTSRIGKKGPAIVENNVFDVPDPYTRSQAMEAAKAAGIDIQHVGLLSDFSWPTPARERQEIELPAGWLYDPDVPSPRIVPGSGTGVLGQYYADAHFQQLVAQRIDPLMAIYRKAPIRGEAWSIRWIGQLSPMVSGDYRLGYRKFSDTRARAWIDGQELVFGEPVTERDDAADVLVSRPPVRLEAGRKYPLKVELTGKGEPTFALRWWSLNQPEMIIPTGQLHPPDQSP